MITQETYFAFAEWVAESEEWAYIDIGVWGLYTKIQYSQSNNLWKWEAKKTTAELFQYWLVNIKKENCKSSPHKNTDPVNIDKDNKY